MFNFAPAIPSRSDIDWCWYLRRQGKSGEALERALHDIGVMDPGGWALWGPSRLTATGAPVEMQFCEGQTDLALITEIADPDSDPTNRMSDACKIMTNFGAKQPDAALRDVISAAQSAGMLTYGARLELRHGRNGLRCALLAELPADATDLSGLMCPNTFGPVIETLGNGTSAHMVRFDGTTGEVTVFFKVKEATPDILPKLTAPAQVSAHVLAHTIDAAIGDRQVEQLGFSYKIAAFDKVPVLQLTFATDQDFGTDADITRYAKLRGGTHLPAYLGLVDNLQPTSNRHHGTIGLTARPGADPLLSICVAAPWNNV